MASSDVIAIVDVHYLQDRATAACVMAEDWAAARPAAEHVITIEGVAPYVPGHFYLRELPAVLAVLLCATKPKIVVIDGYVWLFVTTAGVDAPSPPRVHAMHGTHRIPTLLRRADDLSRGR